MKRSVFRLLSLTLFMLVATTAWGQNAPLSLRYHQLGGGDSWETLTGVRLAAVPLTADSIEIYGGDFTDADWNNLNLRKDDLIKLHITAGCNLAAFNKNFPESRYNKCSGLNDMGSRHLFGRTSNSNASAHLEILIIEGLEKIPADFCNELITLKCAILPNTKYLGGIGYEVMNFSHDGPAGECFLNCYSLDSVYLPEVLTVSRYCFKRCTSLVNISLPKARYLGYGAFSMVDVVSSKLQKVYVPFCDSIGFHCFQRCTSLSELYLGQTPPKLCGYAGDVRCDKNGNFKPITNNDGPDGNVGEKLCQSNYYTWVGVPLPISIVLVDSLTGLPLTDVDLQDAINAYQNDKSDSIDCAFNIDDGSLWFAGDLSTDSLEIKVNGGAVIKDKSLYKCLLKWKKEYGGTVYNSIERLEIVDGVFKRQDWSHLKDSVLKLSNLKYFETFSSSSMPDATNTDEAELFLPKSLETFIGNNIYSVGRYAFYGLNNLKIVELNGLKVIGERAFENCTALTSIKLLNLERILCNNSVFNTFPFNNCSSLNSLWLGPIPPKAYRYNYKNGAVTLVGSFSASDTIFQNSPKPRFLRFMNASTGVEFLSGSTQYKNAKAEYKNHTGYYNSTDKTWLGWTFFDEHTLTVNVQNGVINTNQSKHEFLELDSLAPVQLLPITAVYFDTLIQANSIKPNSGYALRCLDSIMVYKTGDKTQKVTLGSDTTFAMPPFDVTVDVKYERYYTLKINGTAADYSPAGGTATADKYNRRFVNETATLTITPAAGQGLRTLVVKKKTTNEDITPTYDLMGGTIVFAMPSDDVDVTVEFEQLYDVTVLPHANGTATATPQNNLFAGDMVELTVTPAGEYKLRELIVYYNDNESNTVSFSPNIIPGGGKCTFSMPAANVKVKPVFEKSYAVKINGHTADFTDGSNTATADKYDNRFVNEQVTLTITPQAGYGIKSLSVKKEGGSNITLSSSIAPTGGSCTFEMPDGNAEIVVKFEPVYTVSIASYTNGAASASQTANIFANETISLTLTPDAGYGLRGLTVVDANGNAVPHTPADLQRKGGTYEFTMPAANVTVTPVFEQFFHIDGNPGGKLDTLIKVGGMVLPKDSIFADDIIPIDDVVRPDTHYDVCSINIKNLDETHITRDAEGNITHIRMPNPGVSNIEIDVQFCPKYTVEVLYGENHGSGVTDTTYRLLPNQALTIPTDAASCYEKESITVKRADDASDITSQVLGGTNHDVVTMPASPVNMVVNVSYRKQVVTITYNVNDAAYGSINGPSSQTIECGGDGDEVEAVPSDPEKYRLSSWSDGTDIASAKHRATSVNSPITITANFEPIYYTVTVKTAAGGTASANKVIELFKGDNVILTLTPDAGYGLKGLTVEDANGSDVSYTPADIQRTGASTYEFEMPAANVTVTPVFAQLYSILPDPSKPSECVTYDGGNQVCPAANLFAGEQVDVSKIITPNTGYLVDKVEMCYNGSCHEVTLGDIFTMPAFDVEIKVTFVPQYVIILTYAEGYKDGAKSETIPLGPGKTHTFSVEPNECYDFEEVIMAPTGVSIIENGFDRTITMPSSPEDINVQVNYTKKQVILDFAVSPAEAGYIKINGAENYNETADCGTTSFTVEAVSNDDNRYIFKEWSDGSSQGATRTETDVKKNITATAVFTVKHKVTVNATGGSATGDGYYMDGETVTLSLSPAAGFGLRSLKVDGVEVSGLPRDADAHTFTMPAADVQVDVLFEKFYNIYPDPANPTNCVTDKGNKVCPVDSIFAGDRVDITDIVTLATGYVIGDVQLYYTDGTPIVEPELSAILDGQDPAGLSYILMPAYDIKLVFTFEAGNKVTITYGTGVAAGITNAFQKLEPDQSHTFAVTPDECYVVDAVTAVDPNGMDVTSSVISPKSGDQYEVTMPPTPYDIDVEVSYKIKTYTLTYDVRPVGAGSVIMASTSVACGDDAAEATANANSGFRFAKWIAEYNGVETVIGTGNPIALTDVRRDSTLTAEFEPLYEVTVNATNGTVQGAGYYAAGDVVKLSQFKPDAGHKLRHVQSADVTIDFGTDTTFVMPAANVQVDVLFEKFYNIYPDPEHPADTITDPYGNKICPVDSIFAGDKVALSEIVKPQPGYMIDQLVVYYHDGSDWVVLDETTSPKLSEVLSPLPADINATEVTMPPYNLKFEVSFVAAFTITVNYLPAGISEIGDQRTIPASPSTWVPIPIEPKHGYHMVHGGSVEAHEAGNAANDLTGSWRLADSTFLMPDGGISVEMTVEFVKDTFYLYYYAEPSQGNIDGKAAQAVAYEDSGEPVEAKAGNGYRFIRWDDGITDNPRQDKNVAADIHVTAQFAKLYTVTSPDNTVSPSVTEAVAGDTVLLYPINVPNCHVYNGNISASAGTIKLGTLGVSPDTLFMPAADVDVSATFEPASGFSLTATVVNYYDGIPSGNNDGGTITGLPSGTVNCGEEFTLKIINIKEHHRFEGWYENGTLISTKTQIKVTVNTDRNIEARVVEPVVQNTTVDTCGYYKWYGEEFTFTQNRKRVFDGNGAPDTVRTISVTIRPEYKNMDLFHDTTFCGSYTWGNKTYHAEGNYIDTLKTNIHGCDSIVTLRLSKSAPITYSFSESTCEPSIDWNGTIYDENGVFEQSFVTANGCDSIVTLTLSVNDNSTIYHADSIVEVCTLPYVFPKDGNSYGEGVQQIAYEEGTTCKRRHVIKLLISKVNKFIKNETVVSCGPYTLKDGSGNDIIVTQSDVREVKYTTNEGCDSIVTYNITIRDGSTIDARIDTTTCFSSFTLNGQTYSSSNTYTQKLTDSHGCDSIIELNLTMQNPVHKPMTAEDTIKAQAYDSYTWNGSTYISSGFASKEIVSPDGCEITTTILDLTILEAKPVYDTICVQSIPFTWNKFNMLCPQEGNYHAIDDNQGVKEIHYMHLGLAKSVSTNFTAVICEGNNYTWNGQTYSEAGSYPQTFHSGCTDSTVTLNLVSNANYVNRKDVTTCDATYDWFDENGNPTTFSKPGTYTATLPSKSGCDSTVTINLTLNVPTVAITKDTVFCGSYAGPDRLLDKCLNDSIVYNYTIENIVPIDSTITVYRANIDAFHPIKIWGGEFTVGGVFNMDSTSSAGCVHPRKLTINVIEPKLGEVIDTVLCQGQSIAWHGEILSATGNKQAWSVNLDTLHYINLVVLPNTEKGHWGFVCNNGGKYLFGDSAYAAGRYMHPVKYKTNGYQHCDSVRFNLNVMPSSNLVETEDAITCDNELPWVVDGQLYRTFHKDLWLQGKYPMDSLVWKGKSINGCDSTIILNLNFKDTVVKEFTEVACGNYYWHATQTTYNKSGDYWFVNPGCPADSMVLHLTVNKDDSYTHWEQATIREGESYSFMGEIYTETGRYPVLGKTPSGCDLTYMLVLNVISTVAYDSTIVICENQLPYAFDYSDQYKVYHDIITAAGPRKCTLRYDDVDTLMTFHFVIKSVYNKVEKASVCNGKDYTWTLPDGSIRKFSAADNYAGDYVWTDPASISGCESTITLELNSDGYEPITVPVFTCDPEFKSEEDKNDAIHTITVSGLTYPITFIAKNGGCDSVVIYDLHLGTDDNTPYVTYDTSRICGTSYSWNGQDVQWPGYNYEEDLEHVTNLGCRQQIDSMHVIIGNVINNNNSTIEHVCGDDPYFWDVTGQTLDAEGTFSVKHTTKAGCDSTITLTLNRHFPVEHFYHLLVDSSYLYHYRGVRKGESEWFHASDTIIDVLGKGIDPSGACDTVLRVYLTVIDRNLISGIDDNAAEREMLLLHPNPTSGVFFVEASQATEVMLFGISGQLRHRQALLPEGSTQIDVGHLPAGVYIVRAGNLAAKLVKL